MDSLSEIDTEGVAPLNHVMDIENVFREDTVHESMGAEKVLANAPEENENMFQVPKDCVRRERFCQNATPFTHCTTPLSVGKRHPAR